jgi:hypothetical protein
MTTKKLSEKEVALGRRGLAPDNLLRLGRVLCSCGHRASAHAALKHSCHAPGDYKGYCPCMRFIPAKAAR